jgi:hypothetical protein
MQPRTCLYLAQRECPLAVSMLDAELRAEEFKCLLSGDT